MRRVQELPLWLGNIGDARDLRGVLSTGIEALIDLALNEPPLAVTRELVYCRFPLLDGAGNPPWILRAVVRTLVELLRANVPTLVFCSAGMSRTLVIAAAAVAQVRACSLREALTTVSQGGPKDVSPGLLAEVAEVLT